MCIITIHITPVDYCLTEEEMDAQRIQVTWAQKMPKSTQQVNKSQYSTYYLIKSLSIGWPSWIWRPEASWLVGELLLWSRKGSGPEQEKGGWGGWVLGLSALLFGSTEGEEGVQDESLSMVKPWGLCTLPSQRGEAGNVCVWPGPMS